MKTNSDIVGPSRAPTPHTSSMLSYSITEPFHRSPVEEMAAAPQTERDHRGVRRRGGQPPVHAGAAQQAGGV